MLEYVQVRHQGYPFRISFVEFFRRYDIVQWTKSAVRRRLAKGRNRKKRYETLTDLQPKCVDILQYAVDELPKDKASSEYYQLGLSHIYLSYASYTVLEMIIDERRDFWAREIQRIWRGFHLRKKGVSKLAITAAVPLVTKKKLSAGKPIEGDRTTLWDVDTDMSDMTIGTGANRSTTSSSRGANVDALPKTNHEKGFRSDRNNDDVVTVRQAQQQERNGKAGAWDALDLNEDDFYGDNASSSALDFTATADDEQALELMVWLSMLLGITLKLSDEKATTVHLMDLLEDGKILLRACARLITSLPPEKELLLAHPTAKDRVAMARAVMVNFADMDDAAVFNVEDVLEQRNAHRVIQTLAEFKQATGRLEEAQRVCTVACVLCLRTLIVLSTKERAKNSSHTSHASHASHTSERVAFTSTRFSLSYGKITKAQTARDAVHYRSESTKWRNKSTYITYCLLLHIHAARTSTIFIKKCAKHLCP